jgi:hypothetical protein
VSVRLRSTIGAALGGIGILLALGGLFFLRTWMFWAGGSSAAVGIALVVWALRDVGREIGANSARFEAMLRSEIGPSRKEER